MCESDVAAKPRGLIAVLVLAGVLGLPGVSSADEPPGSEESAERAFGGYGLYGGPTHYYRGPLFAAMELSANVHLTENLAATARFGGGWAYEAVLGVPTVVGLRSQFSLGNSTVALGPEVGAMWMHEEHAGDTEAWTVFVAGMKASYEYTFDSGLALGADYGVEWHSDADLYPMRFGLKAGWEF